MGRLNIYDAGLGAVPLSWQCGLGKWGMLGNKETVLPRAERWVSGRLTYFFHFIAQCERAEHIIYTYLSY